MRYRLQRHDGTDCSATMVPITVLRMVPIQRYRQLFYSSYYFYSSLFIYNFQTPRINLYIYSSFKRLYTYKVTFFFDTASLENKLSVYQIVFNTLITSQSPFEFYNWV